VGDLDAVPPSARRKVEDTQERHLPDRKA
jgi:hypothetical protein